MARRRGHGKGGISQRSDGLWVASLSLGTGPDGKRRRKTVYGATQAEAAAKLQELRATAPAALVAKLDIGTETVAQYLDRWLAARKPALRPNTYSCYASAIRNHVVPALGAVRLRDLAAGHVLGFIADSQATDPVTGQPRRSARMVQLLRVVLRLALDHEGHWNRVTAGVSRLALSVPAPKRRTTAWNADEAARFLAVAQRDELDTLWTLAITTGMRQGELLALYWSDIDWKAKTVRVERTLVEIDGKFVGIDEPKTEAGKRTVPLSDANIAALRRQQGRLLAAGQSGVRQVFPSKHAKQLQHLDFADPATWPAAGRAFLFKNRVRRSFVRVQARCTPPVTALTFHELRHTAATLMLQAGVDIKIVSAMLGHSRVEITMNLYQHALPNMQRDAADKLTAVLGLGANTDR